MAERLASELLVRIPVKIIKNAAEDCKKHNIKLDELVSAAVVTAWRLSQMDSITLYEWIRREQHGCE